MLKVDITVNNNIAKMTRRIRAELKKYPVEAEAEFKSLTPVKTGNARRRTNLVAGNEIHANYQYADVLDRGRHLTPRGMRGSTQAPRGMTIPFMIWAKKKLAYIFRKQ